MPIRSIARSLTAALLAACALAWADAPALSVAQMRLEIERMKEAPRGPFRHIRWFCNDGAVLPPGEYACVQRGGGHQHGEWSVSTRRIREAGYPIANILADVGGVEVVGGPAEDRFLRALLLERFLIAADDGWILRQARFYRGAFQIEEELAGAQRILEALVSRQTWPDASYPLTVEAARLLPAEARVTSAARVRGLATAINDADPGFVVLRTKIHNLPGPADAAAVRAYAAGIGVAALADRYRELAAGIDALYALTDPVNSLRGAARRGLASATLEAGAARFADATDERSRVIILCEMMAAIRRGVGAVESPRRRVEALRLLIEMEAQVFARSQAVVASLARDAEASRAEHLALLSGFTDALYGLGLLTGFERQQIGAQLDAVAATYTDLSAWRSLVSALDRVPAWASRRLAFFFDDVITGFSPLEPLAREYIPDRLRGSPLLHYGLVLQTLATDAALQSGVRNELFGSTTVTGLRSLNPGLGRGVLRTPEDLQALDADTGDSIVIVPQTLAELPAVAGIITANEGNALSHVQLLARNLGIPNVVVSADLMPALLARTGQRVELAASPGGVVVLRAAPESETVQPAEPLRLEVDVARLDLATRRLIPTSELTQADSGVRVGPKAAQLGELTRRFPADVSPGLAIPFGVFRHVLDQPRIPGDVSAFEWMKDNYRSIASVEDPAIRSQRTREFLAELRTWIEQADLDPALLEDMRAQIIEHFGPDGSFGVFVRSDTNIEDLPGFTGAGLNLTVPNVNGVDAILAAVRRVWASPFTERAYSWRQALMDQPEHVYAAVLLHASVNADKSGVLITADVDGDDRNVITVVSNEGVGGGVEGQSAEALRISLSEDRVTLLNPATAPSKRVLVDGGGSELVPASGAERVLSRAEIQSLRKLTGRLSGWFGNLPEEERAAAIADVEFGFIDGRLVLFQIRPFVQSKRAMGDPYLNSLDRRFVNAADTVVDVRAPPLRESGQ